MQCVRFRLQVEWMGSMKATSQILLSRPKASEKIVGGGSSYTD